ncbi:MAG: hypothetical protein H6713_03625 [Myxococcales bacterium]|nr:hypothetical protein [Myxococcales bacterium]
MIEAVLLLLCVLGCVVLTVAPLPSPEFMDPKSPRARSMRVSERRWAYTLLTISSFLFLTLYAYSRGADWRAVGYLAVMMVVSIALIHPWLLVRGLLIPLGQVELAYRLSRLGGHPWLRDPTGGAVLSGALALVRRGQHHQGLASWLEGHLDDGPLRGAGVAAAGLLAASRGDVADARVLLESVEALDPELCPQAAWKIAIDWRVADAASRGAWREVLQLGRTGLKTSRTTRLVTLAAARMTGEWAEDAALVRAWLLAPRRLGNLSLLRLALRQAAPSVSETRETGDAALDRLAVVAPLAALDAAVAANDGHTPCADVVGLQVETLAALERREPDEQAALVARLALAWDRALRSNFLLEHLSGRVLEVRASHAAEELRDQLESDVAADLACALQHHRVPLSRLSALLHERERPSPVLARAIDRVTGDLLAEIDETAQALSERQHRLAEQHKRLSLVDPDGAGNFHSIELWRAWLAVRDVYEDVARVGGEQVRRLAFPTLEKQLGRLALWVWQVHDERGFADAIFLWLLREAEALGNTASADTYRHNLAVSF